MSDKKTPDEECTQCRLLDTAWHDLARHPASVPPNWEPGNGQSYAEAVLERLNSQGDDDALRAAREEGWDQATRWIDSYQGGPNGRTTSARSANPHRPVQELPRKKGTVIIPADGHEHVEATCFGIVWRASEAVLDPDGRWLGVWRRGAGGAAVGSVSPGRITPGTWKVEGE